MISLSATVTVPPGATPARSGTRLASTLGLSSGSAPDWATAPEEARPAHIRARNGTRSRFMASTYTPGVRCKKAHVASLRGANPSKAANRALEAVTLPLMKPHAYHRGKIQGTHAHRSGGR